MIRSLLAMSGAVVLAALLSPAAAAQQAHSTPDYFPLEVGNHWTYRTSSVGGVLRRTVDVTVGSSPSAGVFDLENYFGNGASSPVRATAMGAVFETSPRGTTLWYAFPARRSWLFRSASAPGCSSNIRVEVVARNESVDVAAGHFDHCLRLRFHPTCADAGTGEEVFAPDVGLVRRVEESFAGPVTWELDHALLGGKSIPVFPIEVSIALSQTSFTFGGAQPINPPPPPNFRIRLALRSKLGPTTFRFPTTQRYDIRVRDATGHVIWLWSRDTGQQFAKTAGIETAAPGQPLIFEQQIPVVQGGGAGFQPVTRMTVEAILWDEAAANGSEEHMARAAYTVIDAP